MAHVVLVAAALGLSGLGGTRSAAATRRPAPAPERLRIVVLLAQFPDLAMQQPRSHFTDSAGRTGLVERLVDYYSEMSGGAFVLEATVAGAVVTLPKPQVRYVQRPAAMVRDAFDAFLAHGRDDATRSALDTADGVIVFFAGPGKESDLQGTANDPWSNFTVMVPALTTPGGHTIRKGCVIAAEQREQLSSFGVLCHEFGHLLGLPELYAPGGATHEGIGKWGLMGQGTWLGRGNHPPHLSAWSKVVMGWADVEQVTEDGHVVVPVADGRSKVIKLWARGPEHPTEYFLVENRQRRGTDRALPGSGLLIWHIDEQVTGYRTSQSNPEHMRVTLAQADGRDDLRTGHRAGGNRGDAGDPWRGVSRQIWFLLDAAAVIGAAFIVATVAAAWRSRRVTRWSVVAIALGVTGLWVGLGLARSPSFGPATVPGSGSWYGEPGRFTIRRISPAGDDMSFRVQFHHGKRRAPDTGSPPPA
jgi:immune inhibitor A